MELSDGLQSLRQCYEEYLDDRRLMLREGGAFQGISRFFTGPPAGERVIAKRFLQRLEACVAQLDGADAALAAEAAEFMLLNTKGFDHNSQLMFQAAEYYALPLLDTLAPGDAARILLGYTARYPKRKLLMPKQLEVLDALVRAAK